jgi:hypothetical protein
MCMYMYMSHVMFHARYQSCRGYAAHDHHVEVETTTLLMYMHTAKWCDYEAVKAEPGGV